MKTLDYLDFQGMKVELLGTFMFFYIGGWAVVNSASHVSSDSVSCPLAHMITLGLMIWTSAHITGHFNPAVTATFMIFRPQQVH